MSERGEMVVVGVVVVVVVVVVVSTDELSQHVSYNVVKNVDTLNC
jgi:hypothetical protein